MWWNHSKPNGFDSWELELNRFPLILSAMTAIFTHFWKCQNRPVASTQTIDVENCWRRTVFTRSNIIFGGCKPNCKGFHLRAIGWRNRFHQRCYNNWMVCNENICPLWWSSAALYGFWGAKIVNASKSTSLQILTKKKTQNGFGLKKNSLGWNSFVMEIPLALHRPSLSRLWLQ